MALPREPITLTPETVRELESNLSDLRHNLNNNLSLIIAAIELIRRKPEMAVRMVETIADQPAKILEEIKRFSTRLEDALRIVRDPGK